MLCVHFLLLPSEVSPGACSGCIFNMFFHAVVKKKKKTDQSAQGLFGECAL